MRFHWRDLWWDCSRCEPNGLLIRAIRFYGLRVLCLRLAYAQQYHILVSYGWMLAPGNRDVWGRPVSVLMLNDGSLLVSDDGGKKIWRISYGASRS